jgi:hypothetical protein
LKLEDVKAWQELYVLRRGDQLFRCVVEKIDLRRTDGTVVKVKVNFGHVQTRQWVKPDRLYRDPSELLALA